ncbi:MAG: hypothetical protein K2W96_24390 [Gemmataceae bacterium]|nr:hypothetical protein [Gemmataceae bacterium]
MLAEAVSRRRIDPVGASVPLDAAGARTAWKALEEEAPAALRLRPDEVRAWHEDAARHALWWEDGHAAGPPLRALLRHAPTADRWSRLGHALHLQGRNGEARQAFRRAAPLADPPFREGLDAGWAAFATGNAEAWAAETGPLVRRWSEQADRDHLPRLAALAVACPGGPGLRRLLARLEPDQDVEHLRLAALAEVRLGEKGRAAKKVMEADDFRSRVAAALLHGLAGRKEEARRLLAEAGKMGWLPSGWQDAVLWQGWHREAQWLAD